MALRRPTFPKAAPKGGLKALAAYREAAPGRALELVLFALAVPALGHLLFPADPLGIRSGFVWAAVGPIVFAARYGAAAGTACALVAAAAFALTSAAHDGGSDAALVTLAVGTLLASLVVGDVAGGWRRRGLRAEAENRYLRHRLEEFSNDYHVLKVSHGQLEEFMAGQRMSLRQALQRLRPALAGGGVAEAGEELMAVFAQFCSVQVAGLYAMRTPSLVAPEPLAVHGEMGELPLFDPLLRLALAERELVSVRVESAAIELHASGLLAVVPIVDSRGQLHGVLAIRDMHFMAFQQDNLNVLALLAGYVGDTVARGGGLDEAPAGRFVAELDTALRFARSHEVRSSLLSLRLAAHPRRDEIATHVADAVRSLDCAWLPPDDAGAIGGDVVVLLPLVGERGSSAWLERVARDVRERFDVELRTLLVSARILQLDASHTRRDCLEFVGAGHGAPLHGLTFETGTATGTATGAVTETDAEAEGIGRVA